MRLRRAAIRERALLAAGLLLAWAAPALPSPRPDVVGTMEAYGRECRADSSRRMVDLQEIPGLLLDIRYATFHNFTGHPLYDAPKAFLRAPAAARLREAEEDLRAQGLGLKVFDAYRPYSVTVRMWNDYARRSAAYLAPPSLGSDHNRGVAVDVTLVRLSDNAELAMPSDCDSFGPEAAADYRRLPRETLADRALLQAVMARNGFHGIPSEWWHFSMNGAKEYSLLDLSFSELEAK